MNRLFSTRIYILLTFAVMVVASGCKNQEQSSTNIAEPIPTAQISNTKMADSKDDLTLDYCMGKFDPISDDRFVLIEEPYATRKGMYLRKEAYEALKKMYHAAKADGVILIVRSATRNFSYQRKIWENKWTGRTILSDRVNAATDISSDKNRAYKILDYSAMPGASRHHWGTDIDLNSFSNPYFDYGKGLAIYNWLSANAHTFGYCQPYTPKISGRPGYNEEKWHWSYTPLSSSMTSYVEEHLTDEHFKDFLGYETAKDIGVVKKYVLGIDEKCR